MANTQRAALLAKLLKVLKPFKPVAVDKQRSLLEHMLFASCLENSPYDKAEVVFQRLKESFFDWNEVRVSTVTELAEVMSELFDPNAAATQFKRVLQGTFETTYSFDLEVLKKQNLGVAVKQLEKLTNPNSFVMNYAIQNSLGGHAIPLDRGAWEVFVITGMATPQEAVSGNLSGLERTIPKNKGLEFASQIHQLGVEYLLGPQAPNVRKHLTSVNAQAVFPKRGVSALYIPEPPPPPPKPDKAAIKAAEKEKAAAEKAAAKAKTDKAKLDSKQEKAADKSSKGKEQPKSKDVPRSSGKVEKKGSDKAHRNDVHKSDSHKSDSKKAAHAKGKPAAKKSNTKQLAKRKPR